MKRFFAVFTAIVAVMAFSAWAAEEIPDSVKSLVQRKCAGCHKGKFARKGLNLEPGNMAAIVDAPSREVPSVKIVDSVSPDASYLLKKVRRESDIVGKPMPPGKPLTAEEVQVFRTWIEGLKQPALPGEPSSSPGGEEILERAAPEKTAPKRPYEKPAFWGTRLVNLPTTTMMDGGDFLLRISHRFSDPVDSGFDGLFGLDSYANILVSLGYGITDNLGVTVGRSRRYKEFEFSADWLIAKQSSTSRFPVSIALHGGLSLATLGDDNVKLNAAVSLSWQFTRRFSVMAVPAFSTNTNHWAVNPDGTFSLGLGARYMIFEDLSIIAEWVPGMAGYKDVETGWGMGVEKKVGGHVFQFFVTNAFGLTVPQVLPGGDLDGGGFFELFRVGFNIFRTF